MAMPDNSITPRISIRRSSPQSEDRENPCAPTAPGFAGLPSPAATANIGSIRAARPPPRRRPSPNPMDDRRALQNRAAVFV